MKDELAILLLCLLIACIAFIAVAVFGNFMWHLGFDSGYTMVLR